MFAFDLCCCIHWYFLSASPRTCLISFLCNLLTSSTMTSSSSLYLCVLSQFPNCRLRRWFVTLCCFVMLLGLTQTKCVAFQLSATTMVTVCFLGSCLSTIFNTLSGSVVVCSAPESWSECGVAAHRSHGVRGLIAHPKTWSEWVSSFQSQSAAEPRLCCAPFGLDLWQARDNGEAQYIASLLEMKFGVKDCLMRTGVDVASVALFSEK